MRGAYDKEGYLALRGKVAAIVNAADPIGLLALGCPDDEYEDEITRLVPRVVDANSLEDLVRAAHALFVDQFDSHTAGPVATYERLGRELWQLRDGGGVV